MWCDLLFCYFYEVDECEQERDGECYSRIAGGSVQIYKKDKKKFDASFHLENFPRRLIYFTPQEYGKQWNIRTRMTTTVLSAGIFLCDW